MSRLSPLGRAIVDAARDGDRSTALDRTRVRRKLAGAIAAGTVLGTGAASGTAVAATKGALGGGLVWFVTPMAVVAAVGTGTAIHVASTTAPGNAATHTAAAPATARPQLAVLVSASHAPADEAPVAAPIEAAVVVAPVAPPPSEVAPPAPTAVPEPVGPVATHAPLQPVAAPSPPPAPPEAPRVAAAPKPPAAAPSDKPPPADPLAAETERLRAVHGALHDGDPGRALALLERAERGGQLAEERAAARVVALCRLGRLGEGRAALARLASAHAGSPYLGRARAACADE